MKNNIRNHDKNGNRHGVQISYHSNGNVWWIENFNHGKLNGYQASFYSNKRIYCKSYCNMGKWIYEEDHIWYNNQIRIKI